MSIANRSTGVFLAAIFLLAPLIVLLPAVSWTYFDVWRVLAWVVSTMAFVALLSLWGVSVTGELSGLLIDRRNRYSLSRFQILLWTVLAIPAIAVALGSNALRAADIAAFPELILDWTLISLLGISLGSFIVAPVALSARTQATPSPEAVQKGREQAAKESDVATANVSANGAVVFKADAADARLTDLVTGEEVGNVGTLDVARIQMLAITAITWITYAVMLARIFAEAGNGKLIISKFPSFDETLLALILLSHTGYLVGKITPKTTQSSDVATRSLARVLSLQSDADRVAAQIDSSLTMGLSATDELQAKRLRNQLRQISSDADKLRENVSKGEDVANSVATLEGQLTAVRAAVRPLAGDPNRRADADEPGPDLVRAVKRAIVQASGAAMSPAEAWTASDESILASFLKEKGLARSDLPPSRHRMFEDVLDLIE